MNILAVLLLPVAAVTQDPRPPLPDPPVLSAPAPSWDGDEIRDYLDRMHEHSLNAVEAILRTSRPTASEPASRHLAMLMLDEALHYDEPDSNASPAVKSFFRTRLEVAALEIPRTRVEHGVVIWKLYDHAFVVRTATVTVAFDLTRSYWGMAGDEPQIEDFTRRIIDQCDVLFVSHVHDDHFDKWVTDTFLAQDKPVVAPANVDPDEKRITRLSRDPDARQRVKLSNGKELEVVVFPGFQGDLENNVSLVYTPEGLSAAHTGDLFKSNSTPGDPWQWIDHVKDKWQVDMLLVNVWTSDLKRVIEGFNPSLVFTGHENEMGHEPLKRKTNYLAYDRMRDSTYPWVLMTWGESYWHCQNSDTAQP